ncbi:hypothetical protein QNI19_19665 [Cytophagaceae bacterium DM2B3-1]|uniref:Uncharacterized protein n=1 Tax=Xanthocytophaga flava TaxID=3048013 RepID=A0ABT7CN74_9BACT|nr:hypothetical protein [Xanthocytophaga flavus]MDJ1473083.1 hypothetical protein [Xanthocytophaga flavus]MDJ1495167.1 hypothetical protein [Xanthocytophaga flavus]
MSESLFFNHIYIVLLAGILATIRVSKRHKTEALTVLEAMNILIAIGGVVFLLFQLIDFMTEPKTELEQFAFRSRWMGPYALFAWWEVLSRALLPQLFWKRSLRQNMLLSLVICLLQFPTVKNTLIRHIIRSYDYLPSSWAIYPKVYAGEHVVLYLGMVGLVYMILKRKIYLTPDLNN